jgi:hypothetical protein
MAYKLPYLSTGKKIICEHAFALHDEGNTVYLRFKEKCPTIFSAILLKQQKYAGRHVGFGN